MKKRKVLRGACSIAWVGLLAMNLPGYTAKAQSDEFHRLTAGEKIAHQQKIRAAYEANRQQMLDKLGVKPPVLSPPASDPSRPAALQPVAGSNSWADNAGLTYVQSAWGNWTNYDEAKATATIYTLPDPLKLKNGQAVQDAATWWNLRRPEILNDYQTEIYGKIPTNTPRVFFSTLGADSTVLGGKATQKKLLGYVDNTQYPRATPVIPVLRFMPANASGPVPLMVIVWGSSPTPMTTVETLIDAGWAVAVVNTGALQMDSGAGLHEGVIGLMSKGQDRQPDDWGVLTAWSWGLSRVLDYFETDKAINPKQIGIQGHSRWGKTALLAGALDPRWAIVFSSCSGSMGASLEKRNFGETIDNVNGPSEYHWMAGNFLKYGGNWDAMPVDAHELIALVAPRPVFITGGTQDSWADPKGEFLACVAAGPVYELLGKKGVGTTRMPAPDISLIQGDIAFRNHEGGHVDSPDWPVFLQFARRQLNLK
ncbi:alpha/beta hydrolase family protein [Spirosoma spitsbergense]|uniref:alpha/beta hydrolase family protein n=1 Tax=Spirosoma spitsbergense TaxID=431554 RepID=UPI000372B73F|nr:hypothetical protein [Spirosoma spitsbergense]